MKDWSALEDAAQAMRRLNRAVARFGPSDDDLRAIARSADELAAGLETAPRREKQDDLPMVSFLAGAYDGTAPPAAIGQSVEFDPFSPCGGRLHPSSIGLDIRRDGETSVAAGVTVDGMFEGPPGRVHGGIVALIVDELTATVNRLTGQRAFTARLAINLRAPAPIDTPLQFRAWLHEVDGRKITVRAEGRSDEGLFVDADVLFIAAAVEAP